MGFSTEQKRASSVRYLKLRGIPASRFLKQEAVFTIEGGLLVLRSQ